MTIYGFLEDDLFKIKTNINLGNIEEPKVGYLGINEEVYFYKKATIVDGRESRPNFNGLTVTDKIKLYFDSSKYTEEDLAFSKANQELLNTMFEIFEYITLSNTETQQNLEYELTTNPKYSDVYEQGSLRFASTSLVVNVPTDPKTSILVRDYFDIELNIAIPTKFRIWLNRSSFLKSYPYSTIVSVVLPCDHKYILDPTQLKGNIDSIIKSSEFSFGDIDVDMSQGEQSGLVTYKTKYKIASQSMQLLPFGIVYKGAKPSTMEIRLAIRQKLLSFGTAPEAVWKNILPDLFVTGQYFIIPIWDNTTVRPERLLYPSILPVYPLIDKFEKVFPYMNTKFIEEYLQLLTVDQSEIFLIAISDPLNDNNNFSLLKLHPTYLYHSNQSSSHSYMEPNTKEFNIRLNRCMAVLFGEATLDDMTSNIIDDIEWMSFVSTGIEYHVLPKTSYNKIFK